MRSITGKIRQYIFEVIKTLLVEVNDSTALPDLEDRKCDPRQDKRAQVPYIRTNIMLIIPPIVDLQVIPWRNIVSVTLEDQFAIHEQLCFPDTIIIIGSLHIIISPYCKAHLSPGRKMIRQMVGSHREDLISRSTVKGALPCHGASHKTMSQRRDMIRDMLADKRQRIMHIPGPGIVNFEMEMRSLRSTRITTPGDKITLCDRQLVRFESKDPCAALFRILMFADHGLQTEREGFQMAIDTCITLRMLDIDSIAIATHADGDMTHIAIPDRMDGLAYHLSCFYITTTMKMIRPRFSKISRQLNRIMYWRAIRNSCQQKTK